jgi:acyl carrier protein
VQKTLIQLREIFASVLQEPIEKITDDAGPRTLRSWDSLRHVELVIEVESSFGVSFKPSEVFAINSFQGFRNALIRKGVVLEPDRAPETA